jgi:hypothetical protein
MKAAKKTSKAKAKKAKSVRGATRRRATPAGPFKRRPQAEAGEARGQYVHVYGNGVICGTDKRGEPTPRGLSPFEIVVDASDGFIPLWAENTTLYWRFRESSFTQFEDPAAAKEAVKALFGKALMAWGSAAPVKFAQRRSSRGRWDFELSARRSDDCDTSGCVLASAFFPDGGQHQLHLYPELFEQTEQEQIDTLVHELGHVFGLRHFFALVEETEWPSEVFGKHKPFSIMNYGDKSKLTADDKNDLKRLYRVVWSGDLTEINGTEIRRVKPFSAL